MTDTNTGWRKRQIALDIKAENAHELGLDYEPNKTVIEMARQAGGSTNGKIWAMYTAELEAFAALVRADERNRTWTQEHWTEYERSIAAQEKEACAKVCEELDKADDTVYRELSDGGVCANAIRARGETSMTHKEIIVAWNAQADHMNKWDALGEDEKLEWAMKAEREACAKLIKSAQGVLESTEIAHRPPMRDLLEVGRMVRVRLHALADLSDALAAHVKENT